MWITNAYWVSLYKNTGTWKLTLVAWEPSSVNTILGSLRFIQTSEYGTCVLVIPPAEFISRISNQTPSVGCISLMNTSTDVKNTPSSSGGASTLNEYAIQDGPITLTCCVILSPNSCTSSCSSTAIFVDRIVFCLETAMPWATKYDLA